MSAVWGAEQQNAPTFIKKIFIITILIFYSSSLFSLTEKNLNNQLLCTKLLIYNLLLDTDENSIRDRVYSIHLNSLRVDVWTMTGGGFTTREMFPVGLCKFVEIDNFLSYIYALKQTEK